MKSTDIHTYVNLPQEILNVLSGHEPKDALTVFQEVKFAITRRNNQALENLVKNLPPGTQVIVSTNTTGRLDYEIIVQLLEAFIHRGRVKKAEKDKYLRV